MNGIQFVTDENGRKVAVLIDLKKHRALWEDIEDVLVSRSRRQEKARSAGKGKSRPRQERLAVAWVPAGLLSDLEKVQNGGVNQAQLLEAVGRASKRSAAVVHGQLNEGIYSLATIASIAPWVGVLGTILGIAGSFRGISGDRATNVAAIFEGLSESLRPMAFGLLVGLVSLWFYRYLTGRLATIDHEMENASLDLLNQLSRFRGQFATSPAINLLNNERTFGEISLDELKREDKIQRRCWFLASGAIALAWFAQLSRIFGVDALPLNSAVWSADVCVPIVLGMSCLLAYPVWVKVLRRRPGVLIALGSVICLGWSVAELLLGVPLP